MQHEVLHVLQGFKQSLKIKTAFIAALTVFLSSVELLIDCGRERPKAPLCILTKTDKHFQRLIPCIPPEMNMRVQMDYILLHGSILKCL